MQGIITSSVRCQLATKLTRNQGTIGSGVTLFLFELAVSTATPYAPPSNEIIFTSHLSDKEHRFDSPAKSIHILSSVTN